MAKQAKKTQARAPLTRERTIEVAVALADEKGIDVLTMRKLAGELGIEAMSLYHHVANKDEILDAMVDVVFGEIQLPVVGVNWKTAMRERADSAHDVLLGHPWAIALMNSRSSPGPATLRHLDAVLGCLRGAGFSVEMGAHAFSLLDSYIYGFTQQEIAMPIDAPEDMEELAGAIIEPLPMDDFPHLIELTMEHVLKPGYNYSDEFAYGLDLILDALEADLNRDLTT